jgi:hypothetical protein
MTRQEMPKLPQARLYLMAANFGIQELLAQRPMGTAYRFHVIGILASLRAVQHALLSPRQHHQRANG